MRVTFKTRLWLNAALVVIAVILAAVLYFKPGEKKPAPPTLLTQLQNSQVQNIKIVQPNTATVELTRENGTWQMTAPIKMRAEQYEIQSLLNSIRTEVKSSFAAPTTGLDKYGLAEPQLKLWLNGTEFDFGSTEPVDNYRYVLSGGQVHLINGMLFYYANHGPYWWLSKRLLPEGAVITALQLPNASLTLKGTNWELAPANPAISIDAINALIENWQDAEAIGTAKIGNGQAEGEVAIQIKGESTPLRFAILKDPNFFVLARPDLGIEYQLATSQRDELLTFKNPSKPPAATTAKPAVSHTSPSPASSKKTPAKTGL